MKTMADQYLRLLKEAYPHNFFRIEMNKHNGNYSLFVNNELSTKMIRPDIYEIKEGECSDQDIKNDSINLRKILIHISMI